MVPADERDARIAASIGWLISARWASLLAQAGAVVAGYTLLDRGRVPSPNRAQ